MQDQKRSLLVIGVDAPTFEKLAPLLERPNFEVDRFPRGRASLELVTLVRFDTLVAHYPLPDISLQDFLDAVRHADSSSRSSPLLLLTREDLLEEARYYVGKGANRALSLGENSERLQAEVSELLQVAPRLSMRVLASLHVQLDENTSLAMCQTENISRTGMLVRTNAAYPLGSQLRFEFTIPGDNRAVTGEAEVVRHTTGGRENVRGVGVRFLTFQGDGEQRFLRYLSSQLGVG